MNIEAILDWLIPNRVILRRVRERGLAIEASVAPVCQELVAEGVAVMIQVELQIEFCSGCILKKIVHMPCLLPTRSMLCVDGENFCVQKYWWDADNPERVVATVTDPRWEFVPDDNYDGFLEMGLWEPE